MSNSNRSNEAISNIKSMTAYAKGDYENENIKLNIEIKSVNHRFLDLNFRVPQIYSSIENKLRKLIASFVSRGHIDIIITREELGVGENPFLSINRALFESYLAIYEEVFQNYLGSSISQSIVQDILSKRDVITSKDFEITEKEEKQVVSLLTTTLKKLNLMKEKEGEALKEDLNSRFKKLKDIKNKIFNLEKEKLDNKTYFLKLKERLQTIIEDFNLSLNEDRLITEVALLVDKLDITEELVRLGSHFNQVESILKEFPVGRKLEFLLQEMAREFNTIASKANDALVQQYVVEAKSEIEKIREQVQNIE
ncbi:MAG: YicC/YloC family endoribonuclease [Bdellovibrionota bacterium]